MTTEEYERLRQLELWMHEHPPGCTYEYCYECGQPTGNAGRGDGSLYSEDDSGAVLPGSEMDGPYSVRNLLGQHGWVLVSHERAGRRAGSEIRFLRHRLRNSRGGTHLIVELSIPGVKCLIPIAVPSESVGDVVQMMLGRDVAYQDIPPRGRDVCVWKGGDINRALTDAYGFVVRGNAVILSKDVWNHINGY